MQHVLPPLTDFAAYLAPLPARWVVGLRSHCTRCPLGWWLGMMLGCPVEVTETAITVYEAGLVSVHETPPDYRAMSELLDYRGRYQRTVTAEEARQALRDVLDAQEVRHGEA